VDAGGPRFLISLVREVSSDRGVRATAVHTKTCLSRSKTALIWHNESTPLRNLKSSTDPYVTLGCEVAVRIGCSLIP
jgi:hypothetical protein